MRDFSILIAFLLSIVGTSFQTNVKLFADKDFEGLIITLKNVKKCTNLAFGKREASSVDTNGGCIYLYESDNCEGKSLKITPGIHSHNYLEAWSFNDLTSSVGPCPDKESEDVIEAPQYSFYGDLHHNGLLLEMFDVCSCKDLPSYVSNKVRSANTHGSCLKMYDDNSCSGNFVELTPGSSYHGDFSDVNFDSKASSIAPCGYLPNCKKLTSKVYEIKFINDLDSMVSAFSKTPVEIAAKYTIYNNGSSAVTRKISASRTLKQEFVLEKINSLSGLHKLSVQLEVEAKGKAGIPFVAEGEISTKLTGGYGYEWGTASSDRTQNTTAVEKTFTVEEEVVVQPCTLYEVVTFVNFVNDLPIEFDLLMKITGVKNDIKMIAEDIKKDLPSGMEFIRDFNSEMVIAKTKGKMTASFGISAEFEGNGRKLENCQGS